MNLRTALRVNSPATIAFVGAGGKTTSIFRLAHELPHPVIVTTTTHLGEWQTQQGDRWYVGLDALEAANSPSGVMVVTGPHVENGRVGRLPDEELDRLNGLAKDRSWSVLIEADGAHQRPLKAPAQHEPVIPGWVDAVVVIAGLNGLNQRLDNAYIHRPERFSELSGCKPNGTVRGEDLCRVLLHPSGGLKGIPEGTRRIILLNQADDEVKKLAAAGMAEPLLSQFESVLIGCLNNPEEDEILLARDRIAGIILAAGGSTRFGKPKQELLWRGKSFLENVIQNADQSGFGQISVVYNNAYSQLILHSNFKNLRFLQNNNWQNGQSSSIRLGIQSLSKDIGGAVFLLCDQPHIPPTLIRALIAEHAATHAPIIAPLVRGHRGNPVLFDQSTFSDLLMLEGNKGGRALFAKYPVRYLEWHDESILLDVDTPEDYLRLLELE